MKFFISLLFPVGVCLGSLIGGPSTFLSTLLFFPIIPLLDWITSKSQADRLMNPGETKNVGQLVATFWAILYPVSIGLAANLVSTVQLTSIDFVGIVLSAGLTGSIAIVAAHDLVHKNEKINRFLGYVILAFVGYMHFGIMHLAGHHRNIGTKKDLSTAWYGESLYTYLVRSVPSCYLTTWKIENQKMSRAGLSKFSLQNRMIWFQVIPLAILGAFFWILGSNAAVFLVAQAFIAVLMLETVSYIQHYGLMRAELSPNKLEPLSEMHSWESHLPVSTAFLLNIQIHADHHRRPVQWFTDLQPSLKAPQLPFGYPMMISLAFIPVLWKKVMHVELVRQVYQRGPFATVTSIDSRSNSKNQAALPTEFLVSSNRT